jgi:hypothetical protein
MKVLRIIVLGLTCGGFVNQLQASDLEIALSSDAAEFTFRSDSSMIGWGGADLGVSLLFNDADDLLVEMSLMQNSVPSEQKRFTAGVGVKAYVGRLDQINDNVFALGIGGEVRYTFPGSMPMAVYLSGYIAPEITSFGDTDGIVEYELGYQIEILPQTKAFVAIKNIEIESNNNSEYKLVDSELFIGVRLTF